MDIIPFNKAFLTGDENEFVSQAIERGWFSGDGFFTKHCQAWIQDALRVKKALLAHSCTAALEMAAILSDVQEGDEVIMPSYTFVSTANAFVLRGAVPVFVDIREDTLNIDETLIEAAITPRTKAIVLVHYAGVSCEMDTIMDIARRRNILVIEDAAQALMAEYKGQMLGSFGHLAAFSFHETKNIIAGEGGALVVNDHSYSERSEIIREKGTHRALFIRGEVDKYSWVDVGSSYLPPETSAAFLWAQLQNAQQITERRIAIWDTYDQALSTEAPNFGFSTPGVLSGCRHNGHMYYLLLESREKRDRFLASLKSRRIMGSFHYIPLHSVEFAKGRTKQCGELSVTEDVAERIVRLPLWVGLEPYLGYVIDTVLEELRDIA